jgi:hypothetical protein
MDNLETVGGKIERAMVRPQEDAHGTTVENVGPRRADPRRIAGDPAMG